YKRSGDGRMWSRPTTYVSTSRHSDTNWKTIQLALATSSPSPEWAIAFSRNHRQPRAAMLDSVQSWLTSRSCPWTLFARLSGSCLKRQRAGSKVSEPCASRASTPRRGRDVLIKEHMRERVGGG